MAAPQDCRRGAIFREGVSVLKDAGIETPALDAALLLGHATGEPSASLLLDRNTVLTTHETQRYTALLHQRCGRAPISRILGYREFFSRTFSIGDDVLDPRPDTEILVEEALSFLRELDGTPAVLDIGTGSGAIAVTVAAEDPRIRMTATDISLKALAVARQNALRHSVGDRLKFIQTDLLKGLRGGGRFQLVLCNPPYVSQEQFRNLPDEVRNHDPVLALVPGPEGTEYYPPLAAGAMNLLNPGGSLMVEVGAGQDKTVVAILEGTGFEDVGICRDLAGTGRVVRGKKKSA